MSIASDVAAIEAAISKARAWKQNASGELADIHTAIATKTHKKEQLGPYTADNTERTPAQQTFLDDYATISGQVTSLGNKLEEMCTVFEKYTKDTAWVDGFTTDESSWQEVHGTAYQAYESTNINQLKAYKSWQGKDAEQYKANAYDQNWAIYWGASAAENLKKTCTNIVKAAEDFYTALAKEAKWMETNPPDISDRYSKANPPVKATLDAWWESITDPGGMEECIESAKKTFIGAANSAFLSMEVMEVPNRPPDKYPATENIEKPWPSVKVN